MQKPYCKMTLKDLLDLLNAEKQEPARQEPDLVIRNIKDFPQTKIDEMVIMNEFLPNRKRVGGNRN